MVPAEVLAQEPRQRPSQVKRMFCSRASRARPTGLYARAILGAGLSVLRLEKKVFDRAIA